MNTPASTPEDSRKAREDLGSSDSESHDLHDLRQYQVFANAQEQLVNWARRQLTIFAVVGIGAGWIAIVVGWVGIKSLSRELVAAELREATKAAGMAEGAAGQARRVAEESKKELDSSREALEALRSQASELENKLKAANNDLMLEYRREVETLREQFEEEVKQVLENSNYLVEVCGWENQRYTETMVGIRDTLAREGFLVEERGMISTEQALWTVRYSRDAAHKAKRVASILKDHLALSEGEVYLLEERKVEPEYQVARRIWVCLGQNEIH